MDDFQFKFSCTQLAKSSFRIGGLFEADRSRTYRITFKLRCQNITVHGDPLISYSTVENTNYLVHYLSKDMNPADTESMRAAIEKQVDDIYEFAPTVVEDTLTSIKSSYAWHNDFLVEILYGHMFAPSLNQGLNALTYFHNVHPDGVPLGIVLPTDELAIKNTLECKVTMSSSDDCAICLDELPSGCEAVTMPCLHAFHGHCIEEWLGKSHECPLCRHEMPTTQQPTQSNPFQMTRSWFGLDWTSHFGQLMCACLLQDHIM